MLRVIVCLFTLLIPPIYSLYTFFTRHLLHLFILFYLLFIPPICFCLCLPSPFFLSQLPFSSPLGSFFHSLSSPTSNYLPFFPPPFSSLAFSFLIVSPFFLFSTLPNSYSLSMLFSFPPFLSFHFSYFFLFIFLFVSLPSSSSLRFCLFSISYINYLPIFFLSSFLSPLHILFFLLFPILFLSLPSPFPYLPLFLPLFIFILFIFLFSSSLPNLPLSLSFSLFSLSFPNFFHLFLSHLPISLPLYIFFIPPDFLPSLPLSLIS